MLTIGRIGRTRETNKKTSLKKQRVPPSQAVCTPIDHRTTHADEKKKKRARKTPDCPSQLLEMLPSSKKTAVSTHVQVARICSRTANSRSRVPGSLPRIRGKWLRATTVHDTNLANPNPKPYVNQISPINHWLGLVLFAPLCSSLCRTQRASTKPSNEW